jgi:hypothetical protein
MLCAATGIIHNNLWSEELLPYRITCSALHRINIVLFMWLYITFVLYYTYRVLRLVFSSKKAKVVLKILSAFISVSYLTALIFLLVLNIYENTNRYYIAQLWSSVAASFCITCLSLGGKIAADSRSLRPNGTRIASDHAEDVNSTWPPRVRIVSFYYNHALSEQINDPHNLITIIKEQVSAVFYASVAIVGFMVILAYDATVSYSSSGNCAYRNDLDPGKCQWLQIAAMLISLWFLYIGPVQRVGEQGGEMAAVGTAKLGSDALASDSLAIASGGHDSPLPEYHTPSAGTASIAGSDRPSTSQVSLSGSWVCEHIEYQQQLEGPGAGRLFMEDARLYPPVLLENYE